MQREYPWQKRRQQAAQQSQSQIGMCKRCGEAYADVGTDQQRLAWMAGHGENCAHPAEAIDLAVSETMLRILLAMPEGVAAN